MKKNLFRADSSSTIGAGHIMRDLVLAKQFKDDEIIFATQDLEGNLNSKIKEEGYDVKILSSNNIDELVLLIGELQIDRIVIDHYGIGKAYEKELKERIGAELIVLDDTYEEHHCDILLNHNIYADEKKYQGLVPDGCELRCGEAYTLIRDEFTHTKKRKNIFIAMGGSDHSNINIDILKVIDQFPDIEVNLVTTTANQNLAALKEYVGGKEWIHLHIDSVELSILMKNSDFAIVTPSVILNEVFYMELPFVAIQTADNQRFMVEFLEENNYLIINKFEKNKLTNIVSSFFKPKLTNFTELSLQEKKMVLAWRNNPYIKQWMWSQKDISLKEHLSYIESLKEREDRFYFLVKENNKPIGVIDFTDIVNDQASIGLYAKPMLRGVGEQLIKTLIEYGFDSLNLNKLVCEVYADNLQAINLYKRVKFQEIDRKITNNQEVICMELNNENR